MLPEVQGKVASQPDIPLPHNVEVVFGRGKITKIEEARLVGRVGRIGSSNLDVQVQ